MTTNMLTAIVDREINRWPGAKKDKLVLALDDGQCAEVQEDELDPINTSDEVTFFGHWGRYKGEARFKAFTYATDPDNVAAMLDVMDLCDGRKFPKDISKHAVLLWGDKAASIIKRNPFKMLRFPGVGFAIADNLYMELGHNPARIRRQLHCGHYKIVSNGDGSIWFPRANFDAAIRESIDGAEPNPSKAMTLGSRGGVMVRKWTDSETGEICFDGDTEWCTTSHLAGEELCIAQMLRDASQEEPKWPIPKREKKGEITDHQYNQLVSALRGNIGLLMGGGGVGKTFTIAQLIKWIVSYKRIPQRRICLVAPTGRAAVRLTNELRGWGLNATICRTYHSTFYNMVDKESGYIDADVIIGDETSMTDQWMMCTLLKLRAPGCPMLLVGDPYQLPPVGEGAPFRDFGQLLPYGILTETHRNAGTIAMAAKEIRNGRLFETDTKFDLDAETPKNFVHYEENTWDETVGRLRAVIAAIAERVDSPVWDIQVLAVTNNTVNSLNLILQNLFNGEEESHEDCPFRVGDKIMCTENSWMQPAGYFCSQRKMKPYDKGATIKNKLVYVANGEMGSVEEILPFNNDSTKAVGRMVVKMRDPTRYVVAWRNRAGGESTGTNFKLGYAITTHKSQGSQYPFVIAIIDEQGIRMSDRSLWYTQLTRTKVGCVSIGRKEIITNASQRCAIDLRKTFLVETYRGLKK